MAERFLITGFPGFIGKRLVERLATDLPKASFNLLVEPRMAGVAQMALSTLDGGDRCRVFVGDITDRQLGLQANEIAALAGETTHVYHLAAVYNLAVAGDLAERVNVDGTANVVDFCRRCEKLQHLHYASTAYVAGDRTGTVYEHELQMGQGFKNHYERTKFQAEVVVRAALDEVPTTIHRPAVVVGDSRTGETQKFDGPYYALKIIAKFDRTRLPLMRLGTGRAPFNVVPVDFIVEAMATLVSDKAAVGETLHLTDPDPMTASEMYELLSMTYAGRLPRGRIPGALTSQGMRFSAIRKQFGGAPREALRYLDQVVRFDTRRAEAVLGAHGITCPGFREYVEPVVDFFRTHENDPALAPAA